MEQAMADPTGMGQDQVEAADARDGLEDEQSAVVVTDMALADMAPADAALTDVAPAAEVAHKAAVDEPILLVAKRRSFAVEGQGCAVIVVNRLGSAAALGVLSEVDFTTESPSGHAADAGEDFQALSGTLCFGPGVTEMRIRVPLVSDARYEPMERFIVKLTAARGASLGPVTETLVHIVDDDQYPANLPADASEWQAGPAAAAAAAAAAASNHRRLAPTLTYPYPNPNPTQLLHAFYRERWRHRWPKPLKSLFYDMYESFHEILALYLPLACVTPAVRAQPLWLAPLAALYLASAAFNWYCSYQFQNHRGNSGTRKDWRNWLVNRFVWLAEERHVQVDPMRWFHTVRPSPPPLLPTPTLRPTPRKPPHP